MHFFIGTYAIDMVDLGISRHGSCDEEIQKESFPKSPKLHQSLLEKCHFYFWNNFIWTYSVLELKQMLFVTVQFLLFTNEGRGQLYKFAHLVIIDIFFLLLLLVRISFLLLERQIYRENRERKKDLLSGSPHPKWLQ